MEATVYCPFCHRTTRAYYDDKNATWYHTGCSKDSTAIAKTAKKKDHGKPAHVWKTCGVCMTPYSTPNNKPCKKCQQKAHQRLMELKGPKPVRNKNRRSIPSQWSADGSTFVGFKSNTGKKPNDTKLVIPVKVYQGGLCMPK